ncbi:MAG: DUF3098 domain-containing protein [Saprospiraceae bacterium]|nr:DUF3098 domain-containing protein [Saprospiraceae bacterium]
MSASNKPGKKIIQTAPRPADKPQSTLRKTVKDEGGQTLLYGRQHYLLMGGGVLLIALGLILMSGGAMPSPDVWDESIIYSTRRTILAPIVMLAGLGLEIYAIFKR